MRRGAADNDDNDEDDEHDEGASFYSKSSAGRSGRERGVGMSSTRPSVYATHPSVRGHASHDAPWGVHTAADLPTRLAFRTTAIGYSRLTLANATHARWLLSSSSYSRSRASVCCSHSPRE